MPAKHSASPLSYDAFFHGLGHEYQFPPPNLSAGCGFSKQTFAGIGGKEEDAPIPDVRGTEGNRGRRAC